MVNGKEMIYSHREAKTVRYILRNGDIAVVSRRDTAATTKKEERKKQKNINNSVIYIVSGAFVLAYCRKAAWTLYRHLSSQLMCFFY
jgi:hypothetical protein